MHLNKSHSFDDYYPEILRNTAFIDFCEKYYLKSVKKKFIKTRILFLNYLATFLSSQVSKYFSCGFLEEELNLISSELDIVCSNEIRPKSIIHIMTEAYSTGGHTKLVEQLIINLGSEYKHSVLITKHKCTIPQNLMETIGNKGNLYQLHKSSFIKKAKELALIASKYEKVILHIHPYDILPNLAFANNSFKRDIIFFNHADHAFSLAYSIANMVAELSEDGMNFSQEYRGVKNNKVINIPIEKKNNLISKMEAREYLSISKQKKFVLSIASEYKYGDGKEFITLAKKIIASNDNVEFILIGPSTKTNIWNKAKVESKNKINPLGIIPHDKLFYYIKAADLYIESFPFASYTAFLDVASYNVNLLTLKTPIHSLDTVKESSSQCTDINEIFAKSKYILNNVMTKDFVVDLDMHLADFWVKNFNIKLNKHLKNHNKPYRIETKSVTAIYANFMCQIMKSQLNFGTSYKKLPFIIKVVLLINLIKFGLIKKRLLKAISKTLFSY